LKALYLDGSGDHDHVTVDPRYPLSALGGVIVDQDYADAELAAEFNASQDSGHRYLQPKHIANRIAGLNLRTKADNIAGLQFADRRHVLGKPDKEDWKIVEERFRRSPARKTDGYGLVVLPTK
jgi:hypothetical protein